MTASAPSATPARFVIRGGFFRLARKSPAFSGARAAATGTSTGILPSSAARATALPMTPSPTTPSFMQSSGKKHSSFPRRRARRSQGPQPLSPTRLPRLRRQ